MPVYGRRGQRKTNEKALFCEVLDHSKPVLRRTHTCFLYLYSNEYVSINNINNNIVILFDFALLYIHAHIWCFCIPCTAPNACSAFSLEALFIHSDVHMLSIVTRLCFSSGRFLMSLIGVQCIACNV